MCHCLCKSSPCKCSQLVQEFKITALSDCLLPLMDTAFSNQEHSFPPCSQSTKKVLEATLEINCCGMWLSLPELAVTMKAEGRINAPPCPFNYCSGQALTHAVQLLQMSRVLCHHHHGQKMDLTQPNRGFLTAHAPS